MDGFDDAPDVAPMKPIDQQMPPDAPPDEKKSQEEYKEDPNNHPRAKEVRLLRLRIGWE